MLRFHGSCDKVTYEHVGYNSRLDELQAAILRVQLPHLDGWADGRRAAGRAYEEAGLGELVTLPRRRRRARAGLAPLRRALRARRRARTPRSSEAGHGNKAYYRVPSTGSRRWRPYGRGVELPGTDEAARTHLAIPMSPVLTADQAAEVTETIQRGQTYQSLIRAIDATARSDPDSGPSRVRHLATYIASSARPSSDSASSPTSASAEPMLMLGVTSMPPTQAGTETASATRRAMRCRSSASPRSGQTTTNSSPARRATVSVTRPAALRRSAMMRSRSSPA